MLHTLCPDKADTLIITKQSPKSKNLPQEESIQNNGTCASYGDQVIGDLFFFPLFPQFPIM